MLPTAIDKTDKLEIDFVAEKSKLISDEEMLIVGPNSLTIIPLSSERLQTLTSVSSPILAAATQIGHVPSIITLASDTQAASQTAYTSRDIFGAPVTSQTLVQPNQEVSITVQASWQRSVPGILDACVSDDGKFYIVSKSGENFLLAVFNTRQTEKHRVLKVLDCEVTGMTAAGNDILLYHQNFLKKTELFYFNSKEETIRVVNFKYFSGGEFHAAPTRQVVWISGLGVVEKLSEECQKKSFVTQLAGLRSQKELYGANRRTGWIFCAASVQEGISSHSTDIFFINPEGQWVVIVHQ